MIAATSFLSEIITPIGPDALPSAMIDLTSFSVSLSAVPGGGAAALEVALAVAVTVAVGFGAGAVAVADAVPVPSGVESHATTRRATNGARRRALMGILSTARRLPLAEHA